MFDTTRTGEEQDQMSVEAKAHVLVLYVLASSPSTAEESTCEEESWFRFNFALDGAERLKRISIPSRLNAISTHDCKKYSEFPTTSSKLWKDSATNK